MDYSTDPLAQSGHLEQFEIERWRQSWIKSLYPTLQGGIWHCTSPVGYRAIIDEGYIKPNDGTIPCKYPQTPHYFGYQKGYICLFDFGAATEEEAAIVQDVWVPFFGDYEPVTVVLEIDRLSLGNDLIPNEKGREAEGKLKYGLIYYVEAWAPNPIPVSAVERRLIVLSHQYTKEAVFQVFEKSEANEFDDALVALARR